MHLISVLDAKDIVKELFELADRLKKEKSEPLKKKSLAMIFEKPSTRTRISFEVAIAQLGGNAMYMSPGEMQLSRGENIADTARVLSRYVDAVAIRAHKHSDVVEFAKHSEVPVINALTELEHPCQALSDLYTIKKRKKNFDLKLAYIGDGNNVCNSLILACAIVGMRTAVATPRGYEPDRNTVEKARKLSKKIEIMNDPKEAAKDADLLYTDVWISMGQEKEKEKRLKTFKDYKIDKGIVKLGNNPLIMHCLPAKRGLEITSEVLESKNSIVFEQAENRLHMQRAILYKLIKGKIK